MTAKLSIHANADSVCNSRLMSKAKCAFAIHALSKANCVCNSFYFLVGKKIEKSGARKKLRPRLAKNDITLLSFRLFSTTLNPTLR